jgi:hypothetical protein
MRVIGVVELEQESDNWARQGLVLLVRTRFGIDPGLRCCELLRSGVNLC